MAWLRAIGRGLVVLVTFMAMGLGTAWLVLDLHPELQLTNRVVAMFASFIPYGFMAWGFVAMVVLFATRRWRRSLALPALIIMVLQASWLVPVVPAVSPPATGEPFRLMSLNMKYGKAEADQVKAQLNRAQPDVVVLIEYSDAAEERLFQVGALNDYPYRMGNSVPGYAKVGYESPAGTMVYSRYPLTLVETLPTTMGQHVVKVHCPTGTVTVIAAHPTNMIPGASVWQREALILADVTAALFDDGPLVVVGDFNAVPEQVTYRNFVARSGLTNAAHQSGSGWLPTFPANQTLVPPMIAIDHVFVNDQVTAKVVRTFHVERTDHLGLDAELIVSR